MPQKISQKPLRDKKRLLIQDSVLAYNSLKSTLSSQKQDALFASPVITGEGTSIIWFTDLVGKIVPFSQLNTQEQSKAKELLADQMQSIRDLVQQHAQSGLLEFIETTFTIPSEDDIYVVRDGDGDGGRWQIVLTQWGYVMDTPNADTDILTKFIEIPRHKVTFVVRYEDGTLLPDIKFVTTITKLGDKEYSTNSEGRFIVEVPEGKKLSILESRERYKGSFVVQGSKEVQVILPYPSQDMLFEVRDSGDALVPNSLWQFDYQGQSINHTSDQQGRIILPRVSYETQVKACQSLAGKEAHIQQYTSTEGQQVYIIRLPIVAKKAMLFRVVKGKKRIEGAKLHLACQVPHTREEKDLPTNAEGEYIWQEIPLGAKVKAVATKAFGKRTRQTKRTFLHKADTDAYILRYRSYWWLLWFLLLLIPFIPIPIQMDITVLDAQKGKPILKPKPGFPLVVLQTFSNVGSKSLKKSAKKYTGTTGVANFGSEWMYLFEFVYSLNKATSDISCDCFKSIHKAGNFYNLPKKYKLSIHTITLNPIVIDSDDKQPIVDAKVEIKAEYLHYYKESKTLETDVDGRVLLKEVPLCAQIVVIASKYGYTNDTLQGVFRDIQNDTLRLKPKVGKVSFIVKNKKNNEPIPNATVKLFDGSGTEKQRGRSNINGNVALVEFGVKIIDSDKNMKVLGEKTGFYSDSLSGKISYFLAASVEQRTLYLKPKTVDISFNVIDKKTGKPLPNAQVTLDCGGKSYKQPTNVNGSVTFPDVPEECEPKIEAQKEGYFKNGTKGKLKELLENEKKRIIPLEPDVKPQPPKTNCRIFVSGILVSGGTSKKNEHNRIYKHSRIYEIDEYSEYVGSGEYPENTKAFPKAVASSFDGIAVAKGTRVIIYEKPNFQGTIVFDMKGPVIMNNGEFKREYPNFLTDVYPPNIQADFPPSARMWSGEGTNMQAWSTGSIKVICIE